MSQYLKSLHLKDFRSHADSRLSFGPGINLIFGQNGAGKTNTLEAIHYLCLGKSFLTANDRYAVRQDADFFSVTGSFQESDDNLTETPAGQDKTTYETTARITFVPGQGKRILVNTAPLERLSDVLGRFPLVIYAPDDHILTAGPPEERRRFVDSVLCQFKPTYTDNLLRYRRAIKQRNSALQAMKYRGAAVASLAPWNRELVQRGAHIAATRKEFATHFELYLRRAYESLAAVNETPSLTYLPRVNDAVTADDFARAYTEQLEASQPQEIERGRTMVGPHRDEFRLAIDGRELRRFASQGQHRTFGMSLKLGQYRYLEARCKATPLLLLDDAFAHLDRERQRAFSRLFAQNAFGQTIMTAASQQALAPLLRQEAGTELNMIEVSNGAIVDYIR